MGTKVKVAEAVAVGVLVGVLDRVCVAVSILVGVLDGVRVAVSVLVGVLDGGAVRVEVGFFVGDFEGAGVCVGAFVGFDTLAVGVIMVGEFVSVVRKNKLAVEEKGSVAGLAEMAAGRASCVRPKLMNATVDARKRKLIPSNQRAVRIYPCRERKFANLRLACRVRIPNP